MASLSTKPQFIYVGPVAGYEIRKNTLSGLYSLWIGNEQCIIGDVPSERIARALGSALTTTHDSTMERRILTARLKIGWEF